MPKAYLGGVGSWDLTRQICTILGKKGIQFFTNQQRLYASFDGLMREIESSDVYVYDPYENKAFSLSLSLDMEVGLAVQRQVPVVILRTEENREKFSDPHLIKLTMMSGVQIFDLTNGKTVQDLADYLIDLMNPKSRDNKLSWFEEQNTPEEPYTGDRDYLFVSFAEEDRFAAYSIIRNLQENGYRVWYDNQAQPDHQEEKIAELIEKCCCLIALISPAYISSENCKDEISLGRDLNKERLLIYLEKTKLSPGMAMRLLRLQAIHKYTYKTRQEFYDKLYSAKGIHPAKE